MVAHMSEFYIWQEVGEQGYIITCILKLGTNYHLSLWCKQHTILQKTGTQLWNIFI